MEYVVSRTSAASDVKPCDEAVEKKVPDVDCRTVAPGKAQDYIKSDNDWYARGANHRVEDGRICRDLGVKSEWSVEINDLLDFVKRHGECVVSIDCRGRPTIEIYDACRE